jgi:hypothetical protein
MSWFEQATAVLERRKTERVATVDELVAAHAAGKEPSAEKIIAACDAADIEISEYKRRVDHRLTRKSLLAVLPGEGAAQKGKSEAQATIDKARVEFQQHQARLDAVVYAAQADLQQADRQLQEIGRARGKLVDGCQDVRIRGRLNQIGPEIGSLDGEAKALEHRKAGCERELARIEPLLADHQARKVRVGPQVVEGQKLSPGRDKSISWTPGDYDAAEHAKCKAAVEKLRGEIPQIETALAAIPGKVSALNAERAKLLTAAEKSPV